MKKHVEDVMTRDLEVVSPRDTLKDAAEKMRSLNVGSLPVVDNGKLVGIMTDRDIVVRATATGMDPNSSFVSIAMTGDVECVFQDEDLEVALRKMREHAIRRILVVERNTQKLAGIISMANIIEAIDERTAGKVMEDIVEAPPPARH